MWIPDHFVIKKLIFFIIINKVIFLFGNKLSKLIDLLCIYAFFLAGEAKVVVSCNINTFSWKFGPLMGLWLTMIIARRAMLMANVIQISGNVK